MQVGQHGYAGAHVGRPGRDAFVRCLHGQVGRQVPDGVRRGGCPGSSTPPSSSRRARCPPRVWASNAARTRQPLVDLVVEGRGADAGPRVERRDRAVGAERQGHAGAVHPAERVHRRGPVGTEASLVELAGPPHAASNAGWTLATTPSSGERRDVAPAWASRHARAGVGRRRSRRLRRLSAAARSRRRPRRPRGRRSRGTRPGVALGAGDDMVADLVTVQVEVPAGVGVGVRRRASRRPGPDRAVDAEVAGVPGEADESRRRRRRRRAGSPQ